MTAPIRVLWLIKGLGPGGAEQLLVNHARVRDRSRFSYEVAYLVPWKNHRVAELRAAGVPVSCLRSSRALDLRWAWRLRSRLMGDPVDVVHVHSPMVGAVCRTVVRALPPTVRPALVYTEHNRWPRHRRTTRWLNRITAGLDDRRLAVSDDVRASMSPRARRDVRVIEHGVDRAAISARATERSSARDMLGVADGQRLVVTVANLRSEKNYPVLLRAAVRVTEVDPETRFVSVGQGPRDAELRAMHDALGLGDSFVFLGYRPDPIPILAAADVFCLASLHEGLPVALMEAAALGLPVVMTAVGGLPAAARSLPNAILVPPNDPDALARAILEPPPRVCPAVDGPFDIRKAVDELEAEYSAAVR